ncbi:MAG: hypothetical protein KF773_30810 [Deltaproteobacteria bacterium]|nr:hypothetical protein [Deltaproteobacteria bacterium]
MARSKTPARAKVKVKVKAGANGKARAKPTRPRPTKAKAARTRKPPARATPTPALAAASDRGVGLVDRAIAAIRAGGSVLPTALTIDGPAKTKPSPLAASALGKLTLADGRALPPSLARWLAFDGAWLPLRVDRGVGAARCRLEAKKFSALIAERAAYAFEHLAPLDRIMLPGDCYPLLVPSECHEETLVFLYAGDADEHGELPVLAIDFQDEPTIGVYGAGFDLYLARLVGVVPSPGYALGAGPRGYERAGRATFERIVGPHALAFAHADTLALANVL